MNLSARIMVWGTVVILISVLLIGTLAAAAHPIPQTLPDPTPEPPSGAPWLGIYYGEVPPHNPNGPVLVFVHGYRGTADAWWSATPRGEMNDMYTLAYQSGYRTAFVNLGGPNGRETGSMWDNGQLLDVQLDAIARHYGVDTLDIVAHSKGGLDTEAAVAHFGGWRLVHNVFTLGSPHQGSELADLVYSDWASWLTRLLGLQNDAVYTLQTGYMQFFRAVTDPRVAAQDVTYYRAAGTDTGPRFSQLWLTGMYLDLFGPNDGLVTVTSTELPGARTLFIQPYDHYDIFQGHIALPWIDAALRNANGGGSDRHTLYLPLAAVNAVPGSSEPPSQSRVILRGGRISGTVTETVPIESGTLKTTFDLMVPNEMVTATLMAPESLPRPLEMIPPTEGSFFDRIWHLVYTEDNPAPGEWVFTISSPDESAYLLITMIESPLEVTLRGWPGGTMRPGDSLSLEVQIRHDIDYAQPRPTAQPLVRRIEGRITRALPMGSGGDAELWRRGGPVRGNPEDSEWRSFVLCVQTASRPCTKGTLTLPDKEGVYVISATVTGKMADGTPFERSFVRSVAVVKPETLHAGPTRLDE